MPEKTTQQRARRSRKQGKAATTQAGEYVREEMHHVRSGKHGAKSREQAVAIGLSKARRSGVKVPAKGKSAARSRKSAAGSRTRKAASSRRTSRATPSRSTRSGASRTGASRKTRRAAGTAGRQARRSSSTGRRTAASRRRTSAERRTAASRRSRKS